VPRTAIASQNLLALRLKGLQKEAAASPSRGWIAPDIGDRGLDAPQFPIFANDQLSHFFPPAYRFRERS
jgi:hypothetical protein